MSHLPLSMGRQQPDMNSLHDVINMEDHWRKKKVLLFTFVVTKKVNETHKIELSWIVELAE